MFYLGKGTNPFTWAFAEEWIEQGPNPVLLLQVTVAKEVHVG